MATSDERTERLADGHVNPSVVRHGDRVERSPGPNAELVHAVLRHLSRRQPGVAPVPLALDRSAGRETLSFVEGTVPSGGASPDYLWAAETLLDVARLVRKIHDTTADLVTDQLPAHWHSAAPPEWPIEVICHNDIAPWNTVFRQNKPTALIDWDSAAPGPRAWDVAYALWHFVPLYGDPQSDPFDVTMLEPRAERCRAFCDAYGLGDRDTIVDAVIVRQRAVLDEFRTRAAAGERAFVSLLEKGAAAGIQRQIDFVTRHRRYLYAALQR
jgi:phosphotransferase family enzyme